MIEIVVALAVIAVLTAAVAPSLIGVLDRKRVESAAETLEVLIAAMTTMRGDNQDWPGRLTHLAWPITVADRNICGSTYASGRVNNWAGPYLDRNIPAGGLPIGIGIARDSLVREVISGNDSYLKIRIDQVMEEDALALDRLKDGDGSAGGSVRWDTPPDANGQVTVFFLRPIRGC
jgi:type II secretory pathway pseudopilin PulG